MNKKLLSIEQDGFINRSLSFEITLAKNYTFGTFYLPFLAAAKQEYLQALSIHTRSENPDTLFCPGMPELILSRLHAVCVRTLIVEMSMYKAAGKLEGGSSSKNISFLTNRFFAERNCGMSFLKYIPFWRKISEGPSANPRLF